MEHDLSKVHFEQAEDDDWITYTIKMPKEKFGRWPPLRSGLMSHHGIAGWIDDIPMQEGDGVYEINLESLSFLMMNAAFVLANSEVAALEAGITSVEVRA